jgi:hypothetical protein
MLFRIRFPFFEPWLASAPDQAGLQFMETRPHELLAEGHERLRQSLAGSLAVTVQRHGQVAIAQPMVGVVALDEDEPVAIGETVQREPDGAHLGEERLPPSGPRALRQW